MTYDLWMLGILLICALFGLAVLCLSDYYMRHPEKQGRPDWQQRLSPRKLYDFDAETQFEEARKRLEE